MTFEEASPPRLKLPVFATLARSFNFLGAQWRLLALPCLALIVFNLLIRHFLLQHLGNGFAGFAVTILSFMVQASFVVGVHRTILVGEMQAGITFFRFDANWFRYIGAWVVWGAILGLLWAAIVFSVVLAVVIAHIGQPGTGTRAIIILITTVISIAASIGGLFLAARLVLSLPAAAIGDGSRLAMSWRQTRGNVLRMLALTFLIFLPLLLLSLPYTIAFIAAAMTAAAAHQHFTTFAPPLPLEIWISIVGAVSIVVYAVCLSMTYEFLVGGKATRTRPRMESRF